MQASLRAYARRVEAAVAAVVTEYALLIQRDAQVLAPVDTGALRDSIRVELEALAARVLAGGTLDVDYERFVEFGTSRAPAQPFLFPAFERHKAAFVRAVRAAVANPGGRVSNPSRRGEA